MDKNGILMEQENIEPTFNEQITAELLNPYGYVGERKILNYRTSDIQADEYKSVETKDLYFESYIKKTYGTYDEFLRQNRIRQQINVYDPLTDFLIDVTIIKPDAVYKTDHISSNEVILENLTGVCSVWFLKKDGNTRRLNCTLEQSHIPETQLYTRNNFFSPLSNNRIGVWDLTEQKWKSFYMGNVFKFVRDDSTSLE